jgi:hypothetical protein
VAKELNTITLGVWRSDERGRPIHDVRSAYVERCWLPILGPSTLLFLRFAVRLLDLSPDGVELEVSDLARSLGLGGRNGDGTPFRRVIDRAVDFRVLSADAPSAYKVRRHLAELSPRQLLRATPLVRDAHDALRLDAVPVSPTTEHAHRLARTLAALGETPAEIERQLRKWHFSPTTASLSAASAEPGPERPVASPPPHQRPSGPLPISASLGGWQRP